MKLTQLHFTATLFTTNLNLESGKLLMLQQKLKSTQLKTYTVDRDIKSTQLLTTQSELANNQTS